MTLHQLHLICFGAGSMIHGAQTVLVGNRVRHTGGSDRTAAWQGLAIGIATFLWQFGNFFREFVQTVGFLENTVLWNLGNAIAGLALFSFPLLFSYMVDDVEGAPRLPRLILRSSRALRYVLWPWTILLVAADLAWAYLQRPALINSILANQITLYAMLFFFVMFAMEGVLAHRIRTRKNVRANRAGIIAAFVAAGLFIFMLFQSEALNAYEGYIGLAAMMTSVPFSIAMAYRLYQFPFMDAFLRETLSGVILLTAFVTAFAVASSRLPEDLLVFWLAAMVTLLAYAKKPITTWVERTLMGYKESIEAQEARIGYAIRGLTTLDDFNARVAEILSSELDADWVEIGSTARADALHRFEIPGTPPKWLSIGPRIGGRKYMSRELRLARTAALQLSTHHQQLAQHELRDATARAQMRALQAQINPHFLFNTLNVLANLIHTNPSKAEHVTEELAEIFRYALESTRLEWVKLEDELHFLESYLEIEKARFEERLLYSFDVDASLRSLKIPPMILQPLVENAIKHGIGPNIQGGLVRIAGRMDSDRVTLLVEDSGVGAVGAVSDRPRRRGIGLANVRERLHHVYGDAAALLLEEIPSGGTRAELVLPQLTGVQT